MLSVRNVRKKNYLRIILKFKYGTCELLYDIGKFLKPNFWLH